MNVAPGDGRTHWHGCEREHGHHACALAELARLRAIVDAAGPPTRGAVPIGRVVDNNQPGALHVIECPPNTTLDVGDPVYTTSELIGVAVRSIEYRHDEVIAQDAEIARLRAELDAIGAVVGWSRERCEQDGDSPLDCAIMMRADLDRVRTERDICAERYDSLLFAVGTKHPGESRHETALRYIQQAEQRTREPGQAITLAQEPPA